MTVPLMILALLSFAGGFLFNVPRYLETLFPAPEATAGSALPLQAVSVIAGLIGILTAIAFYLVRPGLPESLARSLGGVYTTVYNKFFVDEIYNAAIVRPTVVGSRTVLLQGVDHALLDGMVNGAAGNIRNVGSGLKQLQSGNIRSYAAWVVVGSLAILVVLGLMTGGAVAR